MTKIIFAAILAAMSLVAPMSATNAFAGNGTHTCPKAGTTVLYDEETGTWVCQHPTVKVDGHPAYDKKAKCTPGETRNFRVPLKNGGYRVVTQTCTNNF